MANEIISTITCPHCGNRDATVHQQAKGKRSLYYRCYTSQGGAQMQCGTVQIHGPKGQAWIEANMHREQPEAANDAKAPEYVEKVAANDPKAPETAPEGLKPKKQSSVMGKFWDNLKREED
jgi:hypothetical protein